MAGVEQHPQHASCACRHRPTITHMPDKAPSSSAKHPGRCVGGWLALVGGTATDARSVLDGYLDSVARTDIRSVDGVSRNRYKVWSVLRSLARNVGTEVSIATIARDTGGSDGPVDEDTARSYLAALERSWFPGISPPGRPDCGHGRDFDPRPRDTSVTRASPRPRCKRLRPGW